MVAWLASVIIRVDHLRAALAVIVSRFIDWVANRIFAFSAAQLFISVRARRPLTFVDVNSWVGMIWP
jgi:hypothetical protein